MANGGKFPEGSRSYLGILRNMWGQKRRECWGNPGWAFWDILSG